MKEISIYDLKKLPRISAKTGWHLPPEFNTMTVAWRHIGSLWQRGR